tara:strand:+ start:21905 stop:22222 length:318 start_codon:yes stop_codon:yes gene_type:complete
LGEKPVFRNFVKLFNSKEYGGAGNPFLALPQSYTFHSSILKENITDGFVDLIDREIVGRSIYWVPLKVILSFWITARCPIVTQSIFLGPILGTRVPCQFNDADEK